MSLCCFIIATQCVDLSEQLQKPVNQNLLNPKEVEKSINRKKLESVKNVQK